MISHIEKNIAHLLAKIELLAGDRLVDMPIPALIAASKTRSIEEIVLTHKCGIQVFAENRVQEMVEKWPHIRSSYPEIQLHFIGQLQSNKAAEVVDHCDLLHTLDREKLANAVNKEAQHRGKVMRCLIQVNTGEESQKGGVLPCEFETLLKYCSTLSNVSIEGLMCVPPADEPAAPHFALLKKMSEKYDLPYLSMGMSGDYHEAIRFGASAIRIGTGIFGPRDA